MKKLIIPITVIIVALIIGLVAGFNWAKWSDRAQHPSGPQKRSAVTEVLQRRIPVAPDRMGRMGNLRPTWCPYEDGDPMLHGCIWQSRRTGKTYYVDSSEYLD